MFCVSCGQKNEKTNKYCHSCGSAIPSSALTGGEKSQDPESSTEETRAYPSEVGPKCWNCNAQLIAKWDECQKCGANQFQSFKSTKPSKEVKSYLAPIWVVIGAGVIVLALVVMMLNPSTHSNQNSNVESKLESQPGFEEGYTETRSRHFSVFNETHAVYVSLCKSEALSRRALDPSLSIEWLTGYINGCLVSFGEPAKP